MISFALEIVKDVATTVLQSRVTDHRARAIRALVSLHDSIERVEQSSAALLTELEAYLGSSGNDIEAGHVRARVRDFSVAVAGFAGTYDRVARVLQIFDADLASTFRANGSAKLHVARSLLEVTAPSVCVDRSLPWQQRNYHLRVLDYHALGYSAAELRKQWDARVREGVMMAEQMKRGGAAGQAEASLPPLRWVNVQRSGDEAADHDEHQLEDRIVTGLSVKYVPFDDPKELRRLLAEASPGVTELRAARKRLEEFLARNFTLADFFS